MPNSSVRMFTETICKWCHAVDAGNEADARFYAREAAIAAEVLSIHPEFWSAANGEAVSQDEASRRARMIGTFLETCTGFAAGQKKPASV